MDENSSTAGMKIMDFQDFTAELVDHANVIEYIKGLEEQLKSQQTIIQDLNSKLINYKEHNKSPEGQFVDNATQTNSLESNDKSSSHGWVTDNEEKAGSILEQVTQAAEEAQLQTGFVYEQTTGLYYHCDSGYYYDPKSKLYYNGHTGTYYYYDEESKSYKFYSQVPKEESNNVENDLDGRKKTKKSQKKDKNKKKKVKLLKNEKKLKPEKDVCYDDDSEEEEGQWHSSSCEEESNDDDTSSSTSSNNNDIEKDEDHSIDVAKTYPPCMRVIVKETSLSNLKIGSLFIVTCTGGSIGREGDHSIIVPDINVSKHHAKLQYNDSKSLYEIIDLGSRNGTLLNGKRLSVAKNESEPNEIIHGSTIQLGQTKLLCHIHNGHDTCGHCEPGLLQTESVAEQNNVSLKSQYQDELKRLKSKFGVEGDNTKMASCLAVGYQDRAQSRRANVGSSNQYDKTQQSSLDELISKDNAGFKMLLKMGWTEGKSLGKHGNGITEPVPLQQTSDTGELSTGKNVLNVEIDPNSKKKQAIWRKTQQRFHDVTK